MLEQPKTKEDYDKKYHDNMKITGFGLETGMELPCPFCAAPGFMTYKILHVEEEMKKEHICQACNRGVAAIFTHFNGGKSFEFVQTCGADSEVDYLPIMRRAKMGTE